MSEKPKQWWVTWGMDVVPFPEGEEPGEFESPRVNIFKLPFPSARAAAAFVAELQRYLGDLLQHSSLMTPERQRALVQQVIKEISEVESDERP